MVVVLPLELGPVNNKVPWGLFYKGAYAVRNSFRKTEHVQMVQDLWLRQYTTIFPVDGGDGGYAHGTSAEHFSRQYVRPGHIFPVNNQVGSTLIRQ